MKYQLLSLFLIFAIAQYNYCFAGPALDPKSLESVIAKALKSFPEYQLKRYELLLDRVENAKLSVDTINTEGSRDKFAKSFVDYIILVTNLKKIQYWIGKGLNPGIEVSEARQDYYKSIAFGIGKNCRELVDRVGKKTLKEIDSSKNQNILKQLNQNTIKWIKTTKVCATLVEGLDDGTIADESYSIMVALFPDTESLFEKYKNQITVKRED